MCVCVAYSSIKFHHHILQVVFIGEAGEDTGGLQREFWRLLVSFAAKKYFIGSESLKTFQQNVPALQVCTDVLYTNLC